MGAGQIGGIATLLDMDFNNAAGFEGVKAEQTEAQYVVYYLSHALLFCMGAIIEAHVVLTPALCVFGEKYKFQVFGGTHHFLMHSGISRQAEHVCLHKTYNHTQRWTDCSPFNMALLVLDEPFSFTTREPRSEYITSRLRYGSNSPTINQLGKCSYTGFGSRRNAFLLPLSLYLMKVEVVILPDERCLPFWNNKDQFLCIQETPCKNEKFGALCPDDVGSVIECDGFLVGMMVSRLIDRPCGAGFLNLLKNSKFITCGVDDARDIVAHVPYPSFDFASVTKNSFTPEIIDVPKSSSSEEEREITETSTTNLSQTSEIETTTTPSTPSTDDGPTKAAKLRKGRLRLGKPNNYALRQKAPDFATAAAAGQSNVPVWYSKPQDYYGYL